MVDTVILIIGTAVLSSLLTAAAFWALYKYVVEPSLDHKISELKKSAESIEARISEGVKRGITSSIKELPSTTMKETTRTVASLGTGLVEGGLSSLFKDRVSK